MSSEGQLLSFAIEYPERFGVWSFKAHNLTLLHDNGYEIDLERINSTAEMLDWIFQLNHKNLEVYGRTVVSDLVAAFDAIFSPQAKCCSNGHEKQFSGTDLASTYADQLKEKK